MLGVVVRLFLVALIATAATASAVACSPAATPPASRVRGQARLATATSSGAEDTPRPSSQRMAKLRYEIHGRPFPLPLVTGTIAGQPVLMLVDTGANSHVIAGWLARKLGLTMKKLGDVGTDHVGKTIATFRVEKPELAIDDWGPLVPMPVLATDVPEVIEKLGIGAFISPQRLVEEGDSVVLDLAKGELRPAWWDEAHYELSALGVPLVVGEARACEETEGPIKGLAYVLPATVESQRVDLLLDTGAQHSDVFTTSLAGQRLMAQSTVNKEPMYTASGKISARKLKSARVTAGSFAVSADVDLIAGAADSSCPRDGVLAMDVLRSCMLLLGRQRIYARCLPPSADTPAPR
jgi:predicted aspartyl protease